METRESNNTLSVKSVMTRLHLSGTLSKLLPIGLGIILLSWLVSQLDLSKAVETIRHVPISFLLLGFVCYGGSFYLRALRFRLLLPVKKPIDRLFPIVLVHYTALNVIPARLGELSYVYLLNKLHNVSPGLSISSLVLARVFDHFAISVLFVISSIFVEVSSSWLYTLNVVVVGFLLITLALLLLTLAYKAQCVAWLRHVVHWLKLDRYKLVQRGLEEIQKVVGALENIPVKQYLGYTFTLSIAIWLSIFTVNYVLFRAFDVPLSYLEVMFASTFMILLTVLPFQFFSGIGIRETAWVFIAGALHVSRDVAITSVIGSRIVVTSFLVIFGFAGMWGIRQTFRKEATQEDTSSVLDTYERNFEG